MQCKELQYSADKVLTCTVHLREEIKSAKRYVTKT